MGTNTYRRLGAAVLCFLVASPVQAGSLVMSADDLCDPSDDPCVVDAFYDVGAPLDFGHRTLRVASGGRLRSPGFFLSVTAGRIVAETGGATAFHGGTTGGGVSLTAFKRCSDDPTVRCLTTAHCETEAAGTCTAGNGTVDLGGAVVGKGANVIGCTIVAGGDIFVRELLNFGASFNAVGGDVEITSYDGSITIEAPIRVPGAAGRTYGYSPEESGGIYLDAAKDVFVLAPLQANGPGDGGDISIDAARYVRIERGLYAQSGPVSYGYGGDISVSSGGDLRFGNVDASGNHEVDASGNGAAYYGYNYGGRGGYFRAYADGQLDITRSFKIRSNAGRDSYAGYFEIAAPKVIINGDLLAKGGTSSDGSGGNITINSSEELTVGSSSKIDLSGNDGLGHLKLYGSGKMHLGGNIDIRALDIVEAFPNRTFLTIEGDADVTVEKDILLGGSDEGAFVEIDVCRLRLEEGAKIDQTFRASTRSRQGSNQFTIRESMVLEDGAKILAGSNGTNRIDFRAAEKPPLLLGDVDPLPFLNANASIPGCPVCGNGEIDAGESCDDGNLVSGDGCRNDCQDEGCLLQSPGFPGVALCDDSLGCTLDRCDSQSHTCSNISSCDDSIRCTVDACAGDDCSHIPNDASCDDGNSCTDDLCNATTGCVSAPLNGVSCEDDDPCTPPGNCDAGTCVAGPVRSGLSAKVTTRTRPTAQSDKFKVGMDVDDTVLQPDPSATGLEFSLTDRNGSLLYREILEASAFQAREGTNQTFKYKSREPGVSKLTMKHITRRGIWRIKIAGRDVDLSPTEETTAITAAFLFGSDAATDECASARRVPCRSSANGSSCKQ